MNSKTKFDGLTTPDLEEDEIDHDDAEPAADGALALSPAPIVPPDADGAPVTREQRRSRRKREIRARTISVKRMTKRELEIGRLLYPEHDYEKPTKREECIGGARPCPFVSCKHHLFLDV